MAKKLRQLVELDDPIPAEAVLTNEEELQNIGADENINENTDNYTSENTDKRTTECTNGNTDECTTECTNGNTDECTTECTNENTNEYTNDCINESTDKCTTKCTNENPNKHTNDHIVKSSNTSSNSLQNTNSNSTDNKNAITMRNKFALVENSRGESGELSKGRAIDGVEGGDLPRNGANEGRELLRNGANEGGELSNDRARVGGEDRGLSHKGENSGDLSVDNFVNNKLTIEDRKLRIYQLLHAIAIYKEVTEGVIGVTQLMARVDAFLDPERIEEATTLAMWREKYKSSSLVPWFSAFAKGKSVFPSLW